MKPEFSGECDWCRRESNDLVEHQDFEEGLAGQAWDVCGDCRERHRWERLSDVDRANEMISELFE